ncbi:MAG: M3 family metallopeptidase [Bdellovibrionota bacterium]
MTAANEAAKVAGHEAAWKLSLAAPSYMPAMTYLEDESIREHLYKARQHIASVSERDNSKAAEAIIKLRREKAKLLDYENYADFITDTRMAKSGEKALNFEFSLVEKVKPQFIAETLELKNYKRNLTNNQTAELFPWDLAFYSEKLKKEKYDFDKLLLRPYFEFENVLAGMFTFANKLFDINLVETMQLPKWHEDVKTFEITDSSGEVIAYSYIDLFPRPGRKRDGAWQLCMIHQIDNRPGHEKFIGLFTGNFTKPNAENPALLSFAEVSTLFHEFGHFFITFLLMNTEFLRSVPWDFIELPSKILQNWC